MANTNANHSTPDEYEYRNSEFDSEFNKNGQSKSSRVQRQQVIIIVAEGPTDDLGNVLDREYNYFRDPERRMRFVRKILSIFGAQILLCTALIALCVYQKDVNKFFLSLSGWAVGITCGLLFFIIHIAIVCCRIGYGKPNALNIVLLILTTVLLSIFAASITVRYDVPAIVVAGVTTIATVLMFLIITLLTKIDITDKIMYIMGAAFALILFSIISSVLAYTGVIDYKGTKIIGIIICGLFALVYAIMILYELKMIVGGGVYQYTENDWLVACVSLFCNVVFFFLQIMRLFYGLNSQ